MEGHVNSTRRFFHFTDTLTPTPHMMNTFTNPLLPEGPDPFATFHDGFYYVMVTEQDKLRIRRTRDVTDLANAENRIIGTAPFSDACATSIWAPEIHRVNGRWYVYFTGTMLDPADPSGSDVKRRIFVMECDGDDVIHDAWHFRGPVKLPADRYAIDATILHDHGATYMIWSSKLDYDGGWWQHIMIARMVSPFALEDREVILSRPEFEWERHQQPTNEGPQIFRHGNDIFVAYSGSAFWSPEYAIGFLQTKSGVDLLDPQNWFKHPAPFFKQSPENSVYGCGHNSFVPSPDGVEMWNLYHARKLPGMPPNDPRSPRIQSLTFDAKTGLPVLGIPTATSEKLRKPSGTPDC